VIGVPRVAAGTLERRARVAIATAARELDHRELRGEHSTRLPQLRDRRRVPVDHLLAVRRCAPGRRRAARGEEILRAVRDAEQRPPVAARDRGVRAGGLAQRAFAGQRRDGVVLRSFVFEQVAELRGELDRGDLALVERLTQRGDGREPVSAQGRKTVGGSVAIGTRVFRSSAALFSIPSRACCARRAGSSMSCFVSGADFAGSFRS
jgi:hypothetical protein